MKRHLQLPALLGEMLADGSWKHPGDEVISRLIPFIREPLQFRSSVEQITTPQDCLMGPDEAENATFHEYRGSQVGPRDLPWLDVEQSLLIAINRIPGDDLAIALDYRSSVEDPRVIASEWVDTDGGCCLWREVAPTFAAFLAQLATATQPLLPGSAAAPPRLDSPANPP
ncbi:hypothetical protein [Haloferula sp. BvORR071]|uniref:hypothetical protein n=1 Tax=Haloferula sp. BvORR071 TaxID=1396141 RepID=UPI002240EA5C|nr:hypothetical protein [Haloferula sp. BvORR071]